MAVIERVLTSPIVQVWVVKANQQSLTSLGIKHDQYTEKLDEAVPSVMGEIMKSFQDCIDNV